MVAGALVMKSLVEVSFDSIVKLSFHNQLKPLGFRKKGNNFYSQENGIGHIINLQKSSYYSKDHIHFTINTGIFLPEFWNAFYNYFNKPIPDFPTEPECILRRRIGQLKGESDIWYNITLQTNEEDLIKEMHSNLADFILPHFGKILSKDMLVNFLDEHSELEFPEKLIVFGELGEKEKRKKRI